MDPEIERDPTSAKSVYLQHFSSQTLAFRYKNRRKVTGKQAEKNTNVGPKLPESSQYGVPKSTPNSIKIEARAPRARFLCSQVPLDRPVVAHGVKVEAPGLPNNRLWEPKKTTCISEVIASRRYDMKIEIHKPACLHQFQQRTRKIETSKNRKA